MPQTCCLSGSHQHNLQKIMSYSPAWNILFVSSIVAFLCPVGKQSLPNFQPHGKYYLFKQNLRYTMISRSVGNAVKSLASLCLPCSKIHLKKLAAGLGDRCRSLPTELFCSKIGYKFQI